MKLPVGAGQAHKPLRIALCVALVLIGVVAYLIAISFGHPLREIQVFLLCIFAPFCLIGAGELGEILYGFDTIPAFIDWFVLGCCVLLGSTAASIFLVDGTYLVLHIQ